MQEFTHKPSAPDGKSRMARDVLDTVESLVMGRLKHERTWEQIAAVAAPEAGDFKFGSSSQLFKHGQIFNHTTAADRSKKIYDGTAVNAVDRLASGIEALVAPQSGYWHGLGSMEFYKEEESDDEKRWLERTRNMLFRVRYDADGGFVNTLQTAIRRSIAFGNAFIFVDESSQKQNLISYRYLPLAQSYMTEDHIGNLDQYYRVFPMTARQAVQKFGKMLPAEIIKASENATESNTQFTFVHMIAPRSNIGSTQDGIKGSAFQSIYISLEHEAIVGNHSGYYEMPVVDFRWLPETGNIWGEGPVAKCLADIQSVNLMARNELIASEQAINPPLLVANAGVMNRPSTSPGALNMGGMNASGQKLIEPLFSGQRLDFATKVLESKQNSVKESLYLNLFALLVQNPQMSAHEALIRANEKGELLGPAGSRYQQGLSKIVERELGILYRKGIFDQSSAYRVPKSMQGSRIGAQFTSPMDKLRRSKEAEGTARLLELISPLAQVDPSVVDAIDADQALNGLGEVLGVPKMFFKTPEALAQLRAQRAQQAQQTQQAQLAESYAKAGAQATNALAGAKAAGAL